MNAYVSRQEFRELERRVDDGDSARAKLELEVKIELTKLRTEIRTALAVIGAVWTFLLAVVAILTALRG